MEFSGRIFQIDVDLIDHEVVIATTRGKYRRVLLTARPVAEFYADFMTHLSALGIEAHFRPVPDEVSNPVPFAEDTVHAVYEPEWANRFWRVLSQVDLVMKEHRSHFEGRTSPVHFFWGSFDLANTRFSGRPAAAPAGAGLLARRSENAKQICAGFWPGDPRFPQAAFYSYTYTYIPTPSQRASKRWLSNPPRRAGTLIWGSLRSRTRTSARANHPATRSSNSLEVPMPPAPA